MTKSTVIVQRPAIYTSTVELNFFNSFSLESSSNIPQKNMASIGPPIDQSTFDQIVKENIEDLDMEPEESVQDAIDSLTSQKANMIFIVKEAIILDSEHPGFGKHKCLYLTEELGKLVESDSNLLNDEEKVKQIIEISKELTQELSTDKLPKRYHSCKNGKLHMKLELIYFKIAETLSSDNSTLNLELINSLLNLSINTFQFQPDFVTRQTTTDLCRIMPALEDENLLKILKLISVMSKQHEENRTYFFHGGLFPNVGKLFARDSLSKSQSIDTHNKILAQLCTTIRNFTVDDDPRQTTCRAHDNARDLVNDEAALENLCKFLKNIDDNSYKLKKEVILTLSKLLVRNEFCLKAAEDNCGLLKLITENLEICLKIDENSNNKEQGDTAASAVAGTETVSETVLLRPLLLLLKTMCGNDEVKHRVTQSENLIRNIVANIGKWMAVSSIVDAGLTCCHVLALRDHFNIFLIISFP